MINILVFTGKRRSGKGFVATEVAKRAAAEPFSTVKRMAFAGYLKGFLHRRDTVIPESKDPTLREQYQWVGTEVIRGEAFHKSESVAEVRQALKAADSFGKWLSSSGVIGDAKCWPHTGVHASLIFNIVDRYVEQFICLHSAIPGASLTLIFEDARFAEEILCLRDIARRNKTHVTVWLIDVVCPEEDRQHRLELQGEGDAKFDQHASELGITPALRQALQEEGLLAVREFHNVRKGGVPNELLEQWLGLEKVAETEENPNPSES